jgi:hypothetical protein
LIDFDAAGSGILGAIFFVEVQPKNENVNAKVIDNIIEWHFIVFIVFFFLYSTCNEKLSRSREAAIGFSDWLYALFNFNKINKVLNVYN